MGGALDRVEKNMIRTAVALLILLVLYSVFTKFIISEIDKKISEYEEVINDTEGKISVIVANKRAVDARTNEYENILAKMQEANNEVTTSLIRRNAIPNLLNRIMYAIPKEVQLTSVSNTSGGTIQIEAKSERYQYLGFFIAKLKNDMILTQVTSTEGTKENGIIKITITGQLP